MSALKGDNVFRVSKNMPWYKKETLINTLENLKLTKDNKNDNFCMPVQWVNRSTSNFRGYSGTVVSGSINKKD